MKKRYKRLIYTFEHSVEVYEYLDGKYGAPGKKRGKKRKLTEEAIRYRNQWNRERKVRHLKDVDIRWSKRKQAD